MLDFIYAHAMAFAFPVVAIGMFAGTLVARPLATLIYRLRGKGKYLPY